MYYLPVARFHSDRCIACYAEVDAQHYALGGALLASTSLQVLSNISTIIKRRKSTERPGVQQPMPVKFPFQHLQVASNMSCFLPVIRSNSTYTSAFTSTSTLLAYISAPDTARHCRTVDPLQNYGVDCISNLALTVLHLGLQT